MNSDDLKYLKEITLLYVEDEPQLQEQIASFLKDIVGKLYLASNGEEALELYKQHEMDMVITDITMPKMNGIELAKNIRLDNENLPIFITSAHNSSDYFIQAIEVGISKFILKPIDIEKLFTTLLRYAKNIATLKEKENLKNILEQYKNIVDEKSIVSKTDSNGIITYVNEPFMTISGYKKEELIGNNHNLIRHPDTPRAVFEDIWRTIKVKKQIWRGNIKNRSKKGESYYVDSLIKPILDLDGNIIEFIAIRNDITALENTKRFLQKQNVKKNASLKDALKNFSQYESIVNENNIVSRTNPFGIITYVNEKFLKISQYSKEELIGSPHSIVRHEDTADEVYQNMWQTILAGKVWSGTLKNKNKSGKSYYVDTVIAPIFDKENNISEFLSIRHDITSVISLHQELEDTQREIIYRMGEIGETRSKETGNHVKRVAEYSKLLATLYGLDKEQISHLFMASPMHDIGKVGIPDSVLNKPGKLTSEEWDIMREHSEIGYNILKTSNREILQAAAIISLEHHEKWNGTGYPKGLKEEEIHIFGRITAIADVFDALGSDRCYKKSWELEKILELFRNQRGKHFEPKLVDLFFENLDKFLKIRDKYVD